MEVDHKDIKCEISKHWFHANCIDIEDNEHKVLTTHGKGTIHWCDNCNVKLVEMVRLAFNIQERMLRLLLQPFYDSLDFVRDYPGELVPER